MIMKMMKMHTLLLAEVVEGEVVGGAGQGEEVDVEMGTMTMLMVVGRMTMHQHISAMVTLVEGAVVSGAVAGEVDMVASLTTNMMEAIMMRLRFLLRPEVVVVAEVEAQPEAEDVVATQMA